MFSEHELLILSFCTDKIASDMTPIQKGTFFSKREALALVDKIHNVLRATRQRHAEWLANPDGPQAG